MSETSSHTSDKIFVSFTEEFWPGQKEGTWIGRIEYDRGERYPDELPLSTFDREGVEKLRDKYDFRDLTPEEFKELTKIVGVLNESK